MPYFKELREEIDAGLDEMSINKTPSGEDRRSIQLRRIDNCLEIFTRARSSLVEISDAFQTQMSMGPDTKSS